MRVRGLVHAAVGLAALGIALWVAAGDLHEAKEVPSLWVEVPHAGQVASEGRWQGKVRPAALAARSTLWIDGTPAGTQAVEFRSLGPGYHFIETRLDRRGGRRERVVDTVLVGPFADRDGTDATCGLALSVSEPVLVSALIPLVEEMALRELRRNLFMGPNTRFEQIDFELVPAGLRFSIVVAGKNRVEARGWLMVRRKGDRRFEIRLLNLSGVTFRGQTRETADMAGAAVGAAVAGPLGAIAGLWIVDGYIDDKAKEEIEKAIKRGLGQASELALFPEKVELVPGRPESEVKLALCDDVEITPSGVTARLSVRPTAIAVDSDWRMPGPVLAGVVLPTDGPAKQGVRLDFSMDLANALLEAWAANGLLDRLLEQSDLEARTNDALSEWTTLGVTDVELGLPPVFSLRGGNEAGWAIGLARLRIGLSGVDTSAWGDALFAGRGVVVPHWDDASGRLELAGAVDDVSLTCAREGEEATRLVACLGPLLELGNVASRLNELVAPGGGELPGFDLRTLVSARTDGRLNVGSLEVSRPSPGVLRFVGRVETGPGAPR